MEALTESRVRELLVPYLQGFAPSAKVIGKLGRFVDLLVRWNLRTNLSAVRNPAEIMQRQVGESLFCAPLIPQHSTLLDFGSGAGFPGIPLQLLRPDLQVTLAESQGKKAGFLREAVRSLELPCHVWGGRVEDLDSAGFGVVVMRSVDNTTGMLPVAAGRVMPGGSLVRYTGRLGAAELPGWVIDTELAVPLSAGRLIRLLRG